MCGGQRSHQEFHPTGKLCERVETRPPNQHVFASKYLHLAWQAGRETEPSLILPAVTDVSFLFTIVRYDWGRYTGMKNNKIVRSGGHFSQEYSYSFLPSAHNIIIVLENPIIDRRVKVGLAASTSKSIKAHNLLPMDKASDDSLSWLRCDSLLALQQSGFPVELWHRVPNYISTNPRARISRMCL